MTTPNKPARRAEGGTTAFDVDTVDAGNDHVGQEAWIGTDDSDVQNGNLSWGAVLGGVVTLSLIHISEPTRPY